jgi:YidC/Oxa1 family membrane protein insertase
MDQRNLIVAIVLSVAIVLGFQFLFEKPRLEREAALQQQQAATLAAQQNATPATTPNAPNVPGAPGAMTAPAAPTEAEVLAGSPRIPIETPNLTGSIALKGAKLDDLSLVRYRETTDPKSPEIVLLTPPGTPDAYYAEFGWAAGAADVKLPDANTLWQASGTELSPQTPLTLTWDNGQGLTFERTYSVDNYYLITIAEKVTNAGSAPVTLYPYGLVSRSGDPPESNYYLLFEGALGEFGGVLKEIKYKDLQKEPEEATTTGGWLGFTDKYWLVALVPDQKIEVRGRYSDTVSGGRNKYQSDYVATRGLTLAPGGHVEATNMLFAGAKEVRRLNDYQDRLGINNLSYAVDWGWFFFLTKPIFLLLDWLYGKVGNFGIAILLLTVIVKALFFPLANKSYRAMSKLKKLQPEMVKLRERFGDDKERLNKEMMALYKREKANPAAGCLPIVIQIPVFFSLYKVLFVTIEMRHAPFFGWIHDLSAQDPTTYLNLFGLINWTPPTFLGVVSLGVWPIIMGITMFLQQKLNPQPPDPVQAKMFMVLPFVFTFMLARFPSGLVIYWAWNNCLSILQQWVIMRRAGVKP